MALKLPDCQHIPSNVRYNCTYPWPICRSPKGLDFSIVTNYTNNIYSSCHSDVRLYQPDEGILDALSAQDVALTEAACFVVAGKSWTGFRRSEVWNRLTAWKFPLLQLAFLFPKPPLGFWAETFVVFHLLGDPIGTIADLISTMSVGEFWAGHWQRSGFREHAERRKHWKALTLITVTYAEWGKDTEVVDILEKAL